MDSPALRIAVVGPGRVGQVLARRWREAGRELVGFVGRDAAGAAAAVRFAGGGRVLGVDDLQAVDCVLITVQDDLLAATTASLAAPSLTAAPLYVHCSGSRDLGVLAPLAAAGARVGSFHPLSPFPDVASGYDALPGKPVVIETAADDAATRATLAGLAAALRLEPIFTVGGDRLLYHAACVLAANGLTALHAAVDQLLRRAMPDAEVAGIAPALMQAALDACRRSGATGALSGPVLRGDSALIGDQLAALRQLDGGLAAVYQSLMRRAADLAVDRGALRGASLAAMRQALEIDA